MKVYLAGAMSYYYEHGMYESATDWRDDVKFILGELTRKGYGKWETFDPSIHMVSLMEEYEGLVENKDILHQNNHYLNECDMMIVNLDYLHESPGTLYEIFKYGTDGKPIIAIGYNKWQTKAHVEPLITKSIEIEELYKYLAFMYSQ